MFWYDQNISFCDKKEGISSERFFSIFPFLCLNHFEAWRRLVLLLSSTNVKIRTKFFSQNLAELCPDLFYNGILFGGNVDAEEWEWEEWRVRSEEWSGEREGGTRARSGEGRKRRRGRRERRQAAPHIHPDFWIRKKFFYCISITI